MATAKFDILSNPIATEAIKPVFASVGATDLAVEKVRDAVADVRKLVLDVQKDLVERVAGVQKDINTVVADVRKADAKKVRAAIEARVAELQGEAKTYPAKVQSLVDDNVANASETYADLVKRGETLVGRIRTQESTQETVKSAAKTTAAAKKSAATTAKKKATKKAATTNASAKATATAAKKTAATAAKAVVDAAEKVGD